MSCRDLSKLQARLAMYEAAEEKILEQLADENLEVIRYRWRNKEVQRERRHAEQLLPVIANMIDRLTKQISRGNRRSIRLASIHRAC